MEDIQNYAQITTIAVGLLVLCQVIFIVVLIVILSKIKKAVSNIKDTSQISKDFISSLREEQMNKAPLWRLGLFAFKRARALKKR